MTLAILILAAGQGTRFQSSRLDGQAPQKYKQLAEIGNKTLIQKAIDLAKSIEPEQVHVVLGCGAEKIGSLLKGVHIHVNPKWQSGVASSIAVGIRNLPEACDLVLIFLCDQAALQISDLKQLINVAINENGQVLVCSSYLNTLGVPAVFPRQYFSELKNLQGDSGAKQLLQSLPSIKINLPNAAIDIDTPEDLENFINMPQTNVVHTD